MQRCNLSRVLCAALLGLAPPVATFAAESWIDSKAENVESFLRSRFDEGKAGMVIGLLDEKGRRVFGAGKLDNGTPQEVNAKTVFEIGSVTKVFTSLLLLDAVRRGEMKLTDPVVKYLPEGVRVTSRGDKQIKLLNLAAQDSGLPFFPDNLMGKPAKELTLQEKKEGSDAYTLDKLYAAVREFELTQDPGENFVYSNVGMALLGHAVERKTEQSYESLVVERICRPLGMDDTRITLSPDQQLRLAVGHLDDGSRADRWRLKAMAPSGALLSTANDLLAFLAANLGTAPSGLTPLMKQMQAIRHTDAPIFGRTAMPWVDEGIYQPPGMDIWGHAGGGYGTVAFVAFDRNNRRGVVVLTNQMKIHPNGIGWTLLQGGKLTNDNSPVREVVGVGIGLATDAKTGFPRISTVFPRSPAGRAGLAEGVVIRQINETSLTGKSMDECLALLRGAPGSSVRLEVVDSEGKARTIDLTRQRFLTTREEAPTE